MTCQLIKVSPWIKHFEEGWAADWILQKLINQRVNDRNRTKFRQREEKRAQQLAMAYDTPVSLIMKGNISSCNTRRISNGC